MQCMLGAAAEGAVLRCAAGRRATQLPCKTTCRVSPHSMVTVPLEPPV